MAIYRELLNISNIEVIYDLYEDIKAKELPEKVRKISDYLRDGYKYASNVKDDRVRRMDITRHTDLMHCLHTCTSEMLKPEEGRHSCLVLDDGTRINLEPFFDFLDSLDLLEETIDEMKELEDVLKNYANESNLWDYKECSFVVARLAFLLQVIHNFTNRL